MTDGSKVRDWPGGWTPFSMMREGRRRGVTCVEELGGFRGVGVGRVGGVGEGCN